MKEIRRFREYVASEWEINGACRSCGWHGAMSEYDLHLPGAEDLSRGYYHLPCVSDYSEGEHRGVRIPLDRWSPDAPAEDKP